MPDFRSLCRICHNNTTRKKKIQVSVSGFKPEVEEDPTKMIFWKLFFFFFFGVEPGIKAKDRHQLVTVISLEQEFNYINTWTFITVKTVFKMSQKRFLDLTENYTASSIK